MLGVALGEGGERMCLNKCESCGAMEAVVERAGLVRAEVIIVAVEEGLGDSNMRYLRDSGWSYHSSNCTCRYVGKTIIH